MAIDINFQDELIYITSPQTEVLVQDLVNAIRDREDDEEGILYPKIANATGKQDLATGVQVAITIELLENWQVKFWTGNYTATIKGGNLVGGLGGDPIAYTAGVQVVLIQSAYATIVTSGGSGLTSSESTQLFSLPTLSDIEDSSILAKQADLIRALGLVQENHYIDQTTYETYQEQPLLTGARIRLYSNKASVGTNNNVIARYTITSTWQNNQMQTYKVEGGAITTTTTTSTTAPPHWWYDPTNLIVNTGSVNSGDLEDTFVDDSTYLELNEETGDPGFDYLFEFENVPSKNVAVFVNGYYEGNVAHQKKISAFNFTTYQFTPFTAASDDFPHRTSEDDYQFSLPAPRSNYLSEDGDVIIRIRHESVGTPGHHFHIDRLKLVTVAATTTTTT